MPAAPRRGRKAAVKFAMTRPICKEPGESLPFPSTP
jgi:hypothetical protein